MRGLLYILSTFLVLLNSCEQQLDIKVPVTDEKIVIDGSIENGDFATVIITKTMSFYETIDSSKVRDIIITNAKVTISDGTKQEVLTLKVNDDYFPPRIYRTTEMKGRIGGNYSLEVAYQGKTYSASTSIPDAPEVKSVWFEKNRETDSLGLIYGVFQDPVDEKNYYRVFTKSKYNEKVYQPVYLSTYSDEYFNGKVFNFTLYRGSQNLTIDSKTVYFLTGDTIQVKICAIDSAHFEFWASAEREIITAVNPFATKGGEIQSNISGGAIGIWGGYGASVYEVANE